MLFVFFMFLLCLFFFFFFSSRRRHTRFKCDWSSDVCSSDLPGARLAGLLSVLIIAVFAARTIGAFIGADFNFSHSTSGQAAAVLLRSEERRVGKECRSGGCG